MELYETENVCKKEVSYTEVMFYLEEMIGMEMADEIEEQVYYDLKYSGRTGKKAYTYVEDAIREWQIQKF